MATTGARPFLKWAGGKSQLIRSIVAQMPTKVRAYYEPFLGGGALFWHVANEGLFERAVLNDWNRELVDTYTAVRDETNAVIQALHTHKSKAWNTEEYFNDIRKQDPWKLSLVDRAARMIYLNKTCYNGLYRVSKRLGQFNSPFGDYKNPGLLDSNTIRACSQALKRNVTLTQGDFTDVFDDAGPGDVVYFDPPYVPVSATANFLGYTSDGFSMRDQQRLAVLFKRLATKDVSCLLSNSDHPIVRKLYEDFELIEVKMKRNINSKATERGHVSELLVVHRGAAHRSAPNFDYSILGE